MGIDKVVARRLDENASGSALLVLGMHRSGNSAITAALGLCGAWTGEEAELTGKDTRKRQGSWERRDLRELCDGILHSASADWWKVAGFNPGAIPQEILAGYRQQFENVVAALDERGTWVVNEPRLCLVLPLLADCLGNPVCIHVVRNPLEVAQSLQRSNGFSIAAGLALWEAYNLYALRASASLPRASIAHKSLMLHPEETLNALVERLEKLAVNNLARADGERLRRFIDSSRYRQEVTDEETGNCLLPSQRALWLRLDSDEIFKRNGAGAIPQLTRQYLFDLESSRFSLQVRDERLSDLERQVSAQAHTIQAQDKTVSDLEEQVRVQARALQERDKALGDLEEQLGEQARILREWDKRAREQARSIQGLYISMSWAMMAPWRRLKRGAGWLHKHLCRLLKLLLHLGARQFSRIRGAMRYLQDKGTSKGRL